MSATWTRVQAFGQPWTLIASGWCRAVREGEAQVLLLQHLAESLRAPVVHQELDPGAVPEAPVTVVPEDRDNALPDLVHLVGLHERAEALGEHRVGGQPTADED